MYEIFRPCPRYTVGIWKQRFHLKTCQMFSVHTTPEKFKNTTITSHFNLVPRAFSLAWPPSQGKGPGNEVAVILDFCSSKTGAGEYHDYFEVVVFGKPRFQTVFTYKLTRKAGVSKFLQFYEHFGKAAFSWRNSVGGVLCVQISEEECQIWKISAPCHNRPSSLVPLFQSESEFETFHMKMTDLHENGNCMQNSFS